MTTDELTELVLGLAFLIAFGAWIGDAVGMSTRGDHDKHRPREPLARTPPHPPGEHEHAGPHR